MEDNLSLGFIGGGRVTFLLLEGLKERNNYLEKLLSVIQIRIGKKFLNQLIRVKLSLLNKTVNLRNHKSFFWRYIHL